MLDRIPDQKPQQLATGFQFTEGPAWHPDGYLLFSDIDGDTIYRWIPEDGATPYIHPSRNANGLAFDHQGCLVACEHGGRRLSRMAGSKQMEKLVDRYEGRRLNSPNDVVVHSSGAIYFTDPPYGIEPEDAELDFSGVYRLDPDGNMTLLVSDFLLPNGLAFSPDESTLYIDDSSRRHVRAFDMGPDGSLSNARTFVDMDIDKPRNPDGMEVDIEGSVYITGAGGLWVVDANGRHLGTFEFPEPPANVAFGGPDNQTLYVTARTSLYSVRCKVPGVKAL